MATPEQLNLKPGDVFYFLEPAEEDSYPKIPPLPKLSVLNTSIITAGEVYEKNNDGVSFIMLTSFDRKVYERYKNTTGGYLPNDYNLCIGEYGEPTRDALTDTGYDFMPQLDENGKPESILLVDLRKAV